MKRFSLHLVIGLSTLLLCMLLISCQSASKSVAASALSTATVSAAPSPTEDSARYHVNDEINALISAYNAAYNTPIPRENISQSFSYQTFITDVEGSVYVRIATNDALGLCVDYSDEGADDEAILLCFQKFARCMDPTLSEDALEEGINALREEMPSAYSGLQIGKITASYSTQALSDGTTRYSIKTNANP